MSNELLEPANRDRSCFRAAQEGDPSLPDQDASTARSFRNFYNELRQLFTGIQVAGPGISPDSIDKGFHAIPAIPSTDPLVPGSSSSEGT